MATRIWYPISPLVATSIRYLHDKDLPEEGPHQRGLYITVHFAYNNSVNVDCTHVNRKHAT
jgi:hypothetical protein